MIPTHVSRCAAILLIAGLLLGGALPAAAQDTGAVAGVVVDGETGDPLPGANVSIEGTTTGTATDLNGRYKIAGLEAGSYNVVFSFIGFQQKTVTGVDVQAGQTTTVDITLNPESEQLDEVIITAEAARNTEAGLLKERQKAASMSDAISAEAMGASGAGNAADAMERVTGASVIDGKYVVVRGLGGRYANTQLNGVALPSSDPDRNAVQFDLFPSGLLKNIVTSKTFTPDQPGNFSGGLVDISTKSFPEELNVQFSTSASLNPQVHGASDFLTYPGGDWDWLGFDRGARALPNLVAPLAPDQILDQPIFADGPEEAEQYSTISKSFDNNMAPRVGSAPLNQSYSLTAGNQADLAGQPLGYVLSFSYDRSSSFYDSGTTGRYELGGTLNELSNIILVNDQQASSEATLGAVANATYNVTPNHEVGINTLYTHTGTSTTRLQRGFWTEVDENDEFINRTLLFNERDVFSAQVHGNSYLPALAGTEIAWSGSRARTTQSEPDRRFFASVNRVDSNGDTLRTAFDQGLREPSRLFRDFDETKYAGKADVTVPFGMATRTAKIKFGGAYNTTARDFGERAFSYNRPDPEANISFNGNPVDYFSEANRGIVDRDANGNPIFGLTVDDQTSPFSSYTGDRVVSAGYLMLDVPVTARLRLIGGARLEDTDLSVRATADSLGRIATTDVLPSLNVVYSLQDDMNLRAAATRTLARPTFREIAPYPSFDFIQGEIQIGNPNLNRTLITNLDLRWEWFTRPGEVIAVSGYYKSLDDPIEKAFIGSSSNTGSQLTWKNVDQATVYGAEVEMRTRLDHLHPALQYLTLGGNVSFTHSEIDVPCLQFGPDGEECIRGELVFRQVNNQPSTRDLQGQSPYVVNTNLSYDNPETETTAGVFFNVVGERLSVVSTGSTPDVYEQPRPQLDFTFSQRLLDDWTVKVKAKNVLNSAFSETYELQGQSFTYQRYKSGRSFSLGLTYKPF